MEKAITLTMKEQKRIKVMYRVFRGELGTGEAALVLGVLERIKRFTIPALYIAVFLLCSGIRVLNLSAVEEVRQFPDTPTYTQKATWPLWSWGRRTGPLGGITAWWLQGRSPTVSLFYKLAGVPHPSPSLWIYWRESGRWVWAVALEQWAWKIAILQSCLSILCWALLAMLVSRAIEFYWLKPFAFVIILLFSLSEPIVMWDGTMLSDSISLSLMALFIASWLWLLENWHWRKAATMLIIGCLWTFTRDSNAWIILMLAALLFVIGSLWRSRRYLLVASVLVMFFIANEVSQNYSGRWLDPFVNVLGQRILPNSEWTAYFAGLGMPVSPALMRLSGYRAWDQAYAYKKDPDLQEFRDWLNHHGKSSYTRFLLAHPVMTAQEPLRNIEALIAPRLNDYWPTGFSPILKGVLAEMVYFEKWTLLWVWASGIIVGFGLLVAVEKGDRRWLIPLMLIMLAYPHAALAWHGDTTEVGRHGLQAGVHFRLGLWILLLFVGDMMLARKNEFIKHFCLFPRFFRFPQR